MSNESSCSSCDAPMEASARFCRRCGTPRADTVAEAPIGPTSASSSLEPDSPYGHQYGGPPPRDYAAEAPSVALAEHTHAWLAVAAVIVGLILIAGVAVALVLGGSGGTGAIHAATIVTVTAPSVTAETAPRSGSHERTTTHTAPMPTEGGLIGYHGASFSARIPAGWAVEDSEVQRPNEVETKWRNLADKADYLLIDAHTATHLTPEQDAAPVLRTLEGSGSYEQVYYGPGDLVGVRSWMWIFHIEGDERIDYFFEACGKAFGVLGSTLPMGFGSLRTTFRAVAQSVRDSCQ